MATFAPLRVHHIHISAIPTSPHGRDEKGGSWTQERAGSLLAPTSSPWCSQTARPRATNPPLLAFGQLRATTLWGERSFHPPHHAQPQPHHTRNPLGHSLGGSGAAAAAVAVTSCGALPSTLLAQCTVHVSVLLAFETLLDRAQHDGEVHTAQPSSSPHFFTGPETSLSSGVRRRAFLAGALEGDLDDDDAIASSRCAHRRARRCPRAPRSAPPTQAGAHDACPS